MVNYLLRLPSALLHFVCSFLEAIAIDALSTSDRFLHAECVKPGAWRCLHVRYNAYPSWKWLLTRAARASDVGQLKTVSMRVNYQRWHWLVRHNTLESIQVHYYPRDGRALDGLGLLLRLRVLRVAGASFYSPTHLPALLEVLQAKLIGPLHCLEKCQRLRVLDLNLEAATDLSVLPRLASLRDLTVSNVQPGHLQHVAKCRQLTALRMDQIPWGEIRNILGLPQDGLRTLCVAGCFEQNSVSDVATHFTRLNTMNIQDVPIPGSYLGVITCSSLLRLDVSRHTSHKFRSLLYDLDGLKGCPSLQQFHAAFHRIKNIDGLYHCADLRVLNLQGSFLDSLDALVLNCPKLETVTVTTYGENLSPLRTLRCLRLLDVHTCRQLSRSHLSGYSPSLRRIVVCPLAFSDRELSFLPHVVAYPNTLDSDDDPLCWYESRPGVLPGIQ